MTAPGEETSELFDYDRDYSAVNFKADAASFYSPSVFAAEKPKR